MLINIKNFVDSDPDTPDWDELTEEQQLEIVHVFDRARFDVSKADREELQSAS
tara:strand:+ start:152 stop:310 length:159 start_codon:yes stop_codon:yes gene_type:complete